MSPLTRKRSTSSPKQEQQFRRGTSEKARGQRELTSHQTPSTSRQANRSASTQRRMESESGASPVPRLVRRRSSLGIFFESFSLVRCFTLFGFAVAAVHVILFGLDLAIGWPLQRASVVYDVNGVVCGLALACLSWGTFRDQVREAS